LSQIREGRGARESARRAAERAGGDPSHGGGAWHLGCSCDEP